MADQTEIEVVAKAIAALPEDVRGLVELARWHARQGHSAKHDVFAKLADALEAEHAARVRAEAEMAEARRALAEAASCKAIVHDVSMPALHNSWYERHAAALVKATDTAATA